MDNEPADPVAAALLEGNLPPPFLGRFPPRWGPGSGGAGEMRVMNSTFPRAQLGRLQHENRHIATTAGAAAWDRKRNQKACCLPEPSRDTGGPSTARLPDVTGTGHGVQERDLQGVPRPRLLTTPAQGGSSPLYPGRGRGQSPLPGPEGRAQHPALTLPVPANPLEHTRRDPEGAHSSECQGLCRAQGSPRFARQSPLATRHLSTGPQGTGVMSAVMT